DGGLACAAADMALASGIGIKLAHEGDLPMHGFLFGEDQARYLIAADKEDAVAMLQDAKADDIPLMVVGLAGGDAISVNGAHNLDLVKLREAWEGWLPDLMNKVGED
ncbi:MAG: AIR synthase-related protein, partial [Maricaulis sp.]|nr:AIR synthase-related protein [Maricaulis sp.]